VEIQVEIKTDDYHIWHDPATATVFFCGVLRLAGMEEYRPVMELLLDAVEQTSTFTLNLKELEFLNSSGISILSIFIVKIREQGNIHLVLQGSDKVLWQTKSLRNLQRLMPALTLKFD
jgi:hypothetical protein